MAISEKPLTFSSTSYILGLIAALDISAIIASGILFSNTRSSFYFALVCISLAHLLDLSLENFGSSASKDPTAASDSKNSYILYIFSSLFAWINGCGFITLNALKFFFIGRTNMPKLTLVLSLLAIISVLLCTINNMTYISIYAQAIFNKGIDKSFQEVCDSFFAVWSVYDSFVNAIISMSFIHLLRSIGFSKIVPLRKDFDQLLKRVSFFLIFECLLLLAANAVVTFKEEFDPLWISVYFAEAFRLRVFCMFLSTLSIMLKKRTTTMTSMPRNGSPQLSSQDVESNAANRVSRVASAKRVDFE